jgi:hypothetical protein
MIELTIHETAVTHQSATAQDLNACNDTGCAWYACNSTTPCHIQGSNIDQICPPDLQTQLYNKYFTGGVGGVAESGNWSYAAAFVQYCVLTQSCLQENEYLNYSGTRIPVEVVDRLVNEHDDWVTHGMGPLRVDSIFACPTGGCTNTQQSFADVMLTGNMSRAPQQAWLATVWIETCGRDGGYLPDETNRINELYGDPKFIINYANGIASALSTNVVSGFSRGAAMAIAYGATQAGGATVYAYGTPAPMRLALENVSRAQTSSIWDTNAVPLQHTFNIDLGTFGNATVYSIWEHMDPCALSLSWEGVAEEAANFALRHDYHWATWTTITP